jgi:ZIP family zinc transporter
MLFEPLVFSILTFISTLLGGLFAVKFRNKIHFIMAFSAGVLLGIVAFDILPEIISQITDYSFPAIDAMVALVIGFLGFHILEKSILTHYHHEEDFPKHKHPHVGVASALALAGHSFMDGVAIGLGFQVNSALGILITLAVIAHDFTDGINTVTLMLANKNTEKRAKVFLFLTALTPILGVIFTSFFTVPAYFLFLYLGVFAGFLLYIGASDILPEAHSEHSSYKLIWLTVLEVIFIFAITRFM